MRRPICLTPDLMPHSAEFVLDSQAEYDLIHNSPGVTWMVKPDASAFWYNQAFYNYSGKTPEFMKNWAWQDFLPLEDIPHAAGSFHEALDTGQNWNDIHHIKDGNGTYRRFLVQGVPLKNGKGDIKYWLGKMTDITDLSARTLTRTLKKL